MYSYKNRHRMQLLHSYKYLDLIIEKHKYTWSQQQVNYICGSFAQNKNKIFQDYVEYRYSLSVNIQSIIYYRTTILIRFNYCNYNVYHHYIKKHYMHLYNNTDHIIIAPIYIVYTLKHIITLYNNENVYDGRECCIKR